VLTPQDLADIEEIRRLKARYFYCLDTQDWVGFRAVFTDDAEIGSIEGGIPPSVMARRGPAAQAAMDALGIDAFVRRVEINSEGRRTVHHGHQSEIEITGTDTATGIWAMEDVLAYPDYRFRGAGHYRERYRRMDGAWRIAFLSLTRLYTYAESTAGDL